MPPGDIVNVVNPTDTDFVARYLTNKVTIKAKSNSFVPWDYVVYWMGNPDARDIDHRRRYRQDEVKRIRTLYGAYFDEEVWEQNKPRIEVYDGEGNRIITPAEDPEGTHLTTITSPQSQETLVHQQLANQANVIEQLRKQVEVLSRASEANQHSVATDSNPLIPTPANADAEGYVDSMIPVGDAPTTTPTMTPPPQSPAPNLADQLLGGPTESTASSPEVEEDSPTKVRTS